jgi:carbamoyltransferase
VEADFKDWRALRATMMDTFQGHDRETIAASIQKVMEDVMLGSIRHWVGRSGARRLGLAGGLFANVRLNRLLAESLPLDEIFIFPAMGDDGRGGRHGAVVPACARRHRDWLRHRHRLDTVYLGRNYDGAIDDALAARRHASARWSPGRGRRST